MAQFIEYNYPTDPFSRDDGERDIRPISEFNIFTVDIPSSAIGFALMDAKDMHKAHKVKNGNKQLYYVAHPEEIFTTQQLRDHGPAHTLTMEKFREDMDKILNPDEEQDDLTTAPDTDKKLGTKTIDDIDDMMNEFLSPESPGQVAMNFMANNMERFGCHRVMGEPPMYCVGIPDRATIIDRETRMVISPPFIQ